MREFRSVQKQLEAQLLNAASPTEAREFLQDLQREYDTILEYQTALQDLTLTASEVQHTQRRNSAMRERKLRQQQEEQAAQAMDTDDAPTKRVRLLYLTTHSPSVAVTENVSGVRNATKRSGAPSTSNPGAGSRKAARSTRSSKRRESVQSTASSSNNESSQETIAGRPKYSELAKESGWVDQELIEAIERDIVEQGEKVMFENIAGLEHTKQLLQETVMLPQIAPHLFAAVAHECGTTFFNVSASTLSSKFRGDSEKMVRILFDMARYYEPSIIFMDEIDAIASARGGATEHEASRRVKTELLVQINGVSSGEQDGGRVMLLAATNLPWELDEAMRRRLTKRVYIPLPEAEARRALFELNLKRVEVGPEVKMDDLVEETQVNPPSQPITLSPVSADCITVAFAGIQRRRHHKRLRDWSVL
ncbi:hypothetical protein BBJ28_00021282 [Nothophytophthora sp. Chile5]|nr:hypothetical protein BBJ28_00021282 [Nothophytophthora sp. Chile5]